MSASHSRVRAEMGHVMRWACAIAAIAGCGCGEKPASPAPSPRAPELFENATAKLGIDFIHRAGTNYFMADQIGSGVMVFDFDRDDLLDLYFVQNGGGASNQLFRQQTSGVFTNVSANSGLEFSGRGMGAIAGDLNNDGWPDVVVTEYGATRIFANQGGRFQEITRAAGIENPRWAAPASFIDFDRDGWLDLAVGNYVDYDPTQECRDQQNRQEFCAPAAFPPTVTRLWRNVTKTAGGPIQLEDWTVRSGIFRHPGAALGLVCADFTGDRWPDLFCSDDGRPNRLFVNQRDGTFTEEAALRGLAFDAMGRTAANMGAAFADLTGDGLGDLFVTHLTEEFHSFFRQDQPGLFMDTIAQSGMQQQAWRGTGFGTVAADFNLDGHPDIAFVNGSIRRALPRQEPILTGVDPWWARYAQRTQLFLHRDGKFHDASNENTALCGLAGIGRSLAQADLDRDGAVDLVVGNAGGPAQVYRGTSAGAGHWLKLRLILPAQGGRDAIGAEAHVRGGGRHWWAVLQPATSYLASHEPVLHFGLGTVSRVDAIEVIWPDGETETFEAPNLDRSVTLAPGTGKKEAR